MKPVRLSLMADVDLLGIRSQSAERWGEEQAERYSARLLEGVRNIRRHPDRHPVVGANWPGMRRLRIGSHILFYREETYAIIVIRILHERMDYGSRL